MAKLSAKTAFGVPSQELTIRIDESVATSLLRQAGYAFESKMRELERQFEAKASELRGEYLTATATITGGEA